ncbi:rod-binding protein [Alphaproteobacteria bacterium]|jgi:flagellar protein FlgJ|nr:rod-binding protein [Alphaproteobacteria bacterium]
MIDPIQNIPSFSQISDDKAMAALSDKKQDLKDVADQFEAIFLNFFLKTARQAKLADDPLANSASDTYRDMLDQQYASSLSSDVDLGIAEGLMRQFGKHVE